MVVNRCWIRVDYKAEIPNVTTEWMNYTFRSKVHSALRGLSWQFNMIADDRFYCQTVKNSWKKWERVYNEKLALIGHKYWSFAVPWRDRVAKRVADNWFTGWYSWAMQCVFVLHGDTGNSREIIHSPTLWSLRLSAARSKCYSFHWEQCGNMFSSTGAALFRWSSETKIL